MAAKIVLAVMLIVGIYLTIKEYKQD